MACHPLVDAYDRVPRSLSPIGLLPRVPALMELQQPVARWQRLVYATRLAPAGAAGIPADATALMDQFHDELRRAPTTPWSSSKTWKILLQAARYTATGLQAEWKSGMRGHHHPAHPAAATGKSLDLGRPSAARRATHGGRGSRMAQGRSRRYVACELRRFRHPPRALGNRLP
jgi:hypothetical protein